MDNSSMDYFKNQNDRNDFYISIPVIAIAAVFILWHWGKSDPSTLNNTSQKEIITQIDITSSSKKIESRANSAAIIEKESKISHVRNTNNLESKIVTKPNSNISTIPISDIVEENSIEPRLISDNSQITTEEVDISEEEVPELSNDEDQDTDSSNTAVAENTKTEITKEVPLDCAIAVGLYKNEANLNRMFDRLIKNGYAAIKEPLRNSTKVGIKIPCNKASSTRILQEIRADYASDAFIE